MKGVRSESLSAAENGDPYFPANAALDASATPVPIGTNPDPPDGSATRLWPLIYILYSDPNALRTTISLDGLQISLPIILNKVIVS